MGMWESRQLARHLLQVHLVLETNPLSRLILHWTRLILLTGEEVCYYGDVFARIRLPFECLPAASFSFIKLVCQAV